MTFQVRKKGRHFFENSQKGLFVGTPGSVARKSGFSFARSSDARKSDLQLARKSGMSGANEGDNIEEVEDVRTRASNTLSMQSRASMNYDDANGVAPKRGMTLPFQPLSISFDDVHYFVDMPAVSSLISSLISFFVSCKLFGSMEDVLFIISP